jgi:hypothetical protein
MKAICHREGLLAACQLASAAMPARDVKPILKNIKAIAGDGRCTLMATDMEVGIRLDVQGLTIQEPGEAILPAAKLLAILCETRDNELAGLQAQQDPRRAQGVDAAGVNRWRHLGRQPFGLASPAAWLRKDGAVVSCQDRGGADGRGGDGQGVSQ